MSTQVQIPMKPVAAPARPATHGSSRTLQRKCACGGSGGASGECSECKKKKLQRMGLGSGPQLAPPIVHQVLRSPGRPLDAATRAHFEPRFGHDFSRVRIHADGMAGESARSVNALAYTVGPRIVFGAGQYQPRAASGQRLLAHELTHVVQQQGRSSAEDSQREGPTIGSRETRSERAQSSLIQTKLSINEPGDAFEREADRVAAAVMRAPDSQGVQSSVPVVQRMSANRVSSSLQRALSCDTFNYPGRAPGVSKAPGRSCVDDQGVTGITGSPGNLFASFGESKSALNATHRAQITTLQSSLAPTDTVEIHGYASCDGAPEFNLNLSCDRAEAVAGALSSGPSAFTGSVTTFAHGETNEFGATLGANQCVIAKVTHAAPPPPPPPPPPTAPACLTPPNADESGPAFNPTTSGQTAVVASHPIDAFTANSCADDAFAAAGASGLAGDHLGPQDAFRHCFWACCMAKAFGASEAEEFGTGHENSGPSSIPFDNQQDLHDNSIGRGLAGPTVDCDAACKAAVSSGRLRTIRGPSVATATGLSSPVAADCIGASNQPWP